MSELERTVSRKREASLRGKTFFVEIYKDPTSEFHVLTFDREFVSMFHSTQYELSSNDLLYHKDCHTEDWHCYSIAMVVDTLTHN